MKFYYAYFFNTRGRNWQRNNFLLFSAVFYISTFFLRRLVTLHCMICLVLKFRFLFSRSYIFINLFFIKRYSRRRLYLNRIIVFICYIGRRCGKIQKRSKCFQVCSPLPICVIFLRIFSNFSVLISQMFCMCHVYSFISFSGVHLWYKKIWWQMFSFYCICI